MKLLLLLATTLLAIIIASVDCIPTSIKPIHSLFITPYNLRHYASYIHDSVTVGPQIISFTTGSDNERLIEIPIGELNRYTSVRITVGLNPYVGGNDKDPFFGITDGTYLNEFRMQDNSVYPCSVDDGGYFTSPAATSRTPGIFIFTFTPFHRYGICSIPKDGGYTVAGTFNSQLDLAKDISFRLRRGDSSERYTFYYFTIETFEETF